MVCTSLVRRSCIDKKQNIDRNRMDMVSTY
jgi:hypothetical protein